MRKGLTHLAIVLLSVWFSSSVNAEGIASHQWISQANIEKLPRHQVKIVCLPDPKVPDLLHIRMVFKLESGHSLVGLSISMEGANTTKGEPGERFSGALSIVDDSCSFTVSRKLLDRLQIGYRVSENSYSGHVFGIMGAELPRLSFKEGPPETKVPPKVKKPAEQAAPSDGDKPPN